MAKVKSIIGRWLDTTQKKIIFGGMVCFLLAGLIPPLMHSKYHFSCGYGFMFLPRNCVGSIGGLERIDFYRSSVEWILVVVLTGGLLFLSKEQKSK